MKPLLIDGVWTTTPDGYENMNPSDTSDIIDVYAQAGRAEAQAAIGAAQAAFSKGEFSGPQRRHDILKAVGDEILARKDEIGRFLSREEGKTVGEGIAEASRAASIFDFFAGEALRITGDRLASVRPNIGIEVTREPMGVVSVITPWNFPFAIPAWKIAPALLTGTRWCSSRRSWCPVARGFSSTSCTAPEFRQVC